MGSKPRMNNFELPTKVPKAQKAHAVSKKSSARIAATQRSRYIAAASPTDTGVPDATPDIAPATPFSTTSIAQAASVLPANSMWMWAIAGLTLLTGAGVLASRHVARDEWEIEDVGESD